MNQVRIFFVWPLSVEGILHGHGEAQCFNHTCTYIYSLFQHRFILLYEGIDSHGGGNAYGENESAMRQGPAEVVYFPTIYFLHGVDVPILGVELTEGQAAHE